MPLPPWVATVYLNKTDMSRGWSEAYYPIGPSIDDADANMQAVINARIAMLPPNYVIAWARVDNPDTPRDSKFVSSIAYPAPGTYAPTPPTYLEKTEAATLWEFVGSPTIKNRKFIHGLVNVDITNGDTYTPTPALGTATTAWASAVMANCFAWGGPSLLYIPIVQVLVKGLTTRRVGRPFGLRPGRA